jgi:hypothetical protein
MRFKAKYIGMPVVLLAGIAVFGWVVMMLWNAVVPDVFSGLHAIDYRQALGVLILARILFGGLRGRGGFRGGRRWQRLERMTLEERALFLHRGGCASSHDAERRS